MARLWRLACPGMGAGHLPDAGGAGEQAAIMMDAFAVMSAAEAELRKANEPDRRG
jgi:hypothetical protein